MSVDYIERTTSLIRRVPGLELAPHAVRLLARGEPVELEQIAAASGWTPKIIFPVILGRSGLVESTCPQTGRPIRIELGPDAVELVDPPEAIVSAVRPSGTLPDVRTTTCDHGHFFSSAAAATGWAAENPDGYLHGVEEAFRLDREVITQLGWAATPAQAARTAGEPG